MSNNDIKGQETYNDRVRLKYACSVCGNTAKALLYPETDSYDVYLYDKEGEVIRTFTNN